MKQKIVMKMMKTTSTIGNDHADQDECHHEHEGKNMDIDIGIRISAR